MDFHGLTRRQLQALCKANSIPANMTNLAMADALSALDNVEGIEEVMLPQSPGKLDSESPEVPRTVTRTSTRVRKPPVRIMESGGVVSHSRSRISRKLDADDVDDKDEKNDVAKTPAVAGSRKHAPAIASRRKAEVPTVQKVYSTRRSVRLVEKQLSELCLGESKTKTQPIKFDIELSSEITESDVKGDNLAEVSNEKSIRDFTDDEVDTACVVQENKVASNVAAVEVVVEAAAEKIPKSEIVIDEVPMKSDSDNQKDISIDGGEFDSLAMVEESSFEIPVDQVEVEENINEVMKMETQVNNLYSDAAAATEDSNTNYLEQKAELVVDETVEAPSNNDNIEDSTDFVNVKEQQMGCEDLEELNSDIVKDSAPETKKTGKENNVDCGKAPKKAPEQMSVRELRKMVKEMTISKTGNRDKEGDANKHQDTPRPTRHALETLPCNAHV